MVLRKSRLTFVRIAALPVVLLSVLVGSPLARWPALEEGVELVGYVFIGVGLAFRLWSWLYMGERKSRGLVTDGPYSVCRNPLYLGTALIAIGLGMCLANLVVIILTLLVVIPLHVLVALAEEEHLEEAFGEQYLAYKERVPRFIPAPSLYCSRETIEVTPYIVRKAGRDALLVVLAPSVAGVVHLLQESGVIPVLWRLL